MAKYMIHACDRRMWYVGEHLIPSMLNQGIELRDIRVFNDDKGLGNLKAFRKSIELLDDSEEGTWHLQDDIIISRDFKYQTEIHNQGIVFGFCGYYDEPSTDRWYSFPCIRIPNAVLRDFDIWLDIVRDEHDYHRMMINKNKYDDSLFRDYCTEQGFKNYEKLVPNIVDHIDYLLGGSIANDGRKDNINLRSKLWEEEHLVTALARKIMK